MIKTGGKVYNKEEEEEQNKPHFYCNVNYLSNEAISILKITVKIHLYFEVDMKISAGGHFKQPSRDQQPLRSTFYEEGLLLSKQNSKAITSSIYHFFLLPPHSLQTRVVSVSRNLLLYIFPLLFQFVII